MNKPILIATAIVLAGLSSPGFGQVAQNVEAKCLVGESAECVFVNRGTVPGGACAVITLTRIHPANIYDHGYKFTEKFVKTAPICSGPLAPGATVTKTESVFRVPGAGTQLDSFTFCRSRAVVVPLYFCDVNTTVEPSP